MPIVGSSREILSIATQLGSLEGQCLVLSPQGPITLLMPIVLAKVTLLNAVDAIARPADVLVVVLPHI